MAPAKRRLKLRDVYKRAAFIQVAAARDFKVKYKQSVLGPIWLVFQPVALLLAFVVAFRGLGRVHTSHVPYAVFALVGLSVWSFFQASMTIGAASLLSNANFIRYTPAPRPAFPIAAIIASLPSFVLTATAAIIAAAATGNLSVRVLLLPLGLLWLFALIIGVVEILCPLAVRYRDVTSALPFLLQVGVFLVPVGYSLAGLSSAVRTIVELNPLTGLIEAWRWMLLSGYHPTVLPIIWSLAVAPTLLVSGWLIFSRLETTMADII